MFNLGFPELILILIIALVVFGPRKLPEIGKALGRSVKEFKEGKDEVEKSIVDVTPESSTLAKKDEKSEK